MRRCCRSGRRLVLAGQLGDPRLDHVAGLVLHARDGVQPALALVQPADLPGDRRSIARRVRTLANTPPFGEGAGAGFDVFLVRFESPGTARKLNSVHAVRLVSE